MSSPRPPSGPRLSPELTQRMGPVREAFSKLRDNHLAWILNAATGHFAEEFEETEMEILRYQGLPDAPIYNAYGRARDGATPTTRAKELPRLRARLEEYHRILDFLDAHKSAGACGAPRHSPLSSAIAACSTSEPPGGRLGGRPAETGGTAWARASAPRSRPARAARAAPGAPAVSCLSD